MKVRVLQKFVPYLSSLNEKYPPNISNHRSLILHLLHLGLNLSRYPIRY